MAVSRNRARQLAGQREAAAVAESVDGDEACIVIADDDVVVYRHCRYVEVVFKGLSEMLACVVQIAIELTARQADVAGDGLVALALDIAPAQYLKTPAQLAGATAELLNEPLYESWLLQRCHTAPNLRDARVAG